MKIEHYPILKLETILKYLEEGKDDIKYVCTSAIEEGGIKAWDIYYIINRKSNHTNKYVGFSVIRVDDGYKLRVTNADNIENLKFYFIDCNGAKYYSQNRWDYKEIGNKIIDGGRSYCRTNTTYETYVIRKGEFIKLNDEEDGKSITLSCSEERE